MDPIEIPLYVLCSLAFIFYSTFHSYTNNFRRTSSFQTSIMKFRNCFSNYGLDDIIFKISTSISSDALFLSISFFTFTLLRPPFFFFLEACIVMFGCLLVQFYFRWNLQLYMMGFEVGLEGFSFPFFLQIRTSFLIYRNAPCIIHIFV